MPISSINDQDSSTVSRFLTELIPNNTIRQFCLHIFATSIIRAHDHNPRSWGTTFFPGGETAIRLTVGMIYVCNLYEGGMSLTLYAPEQDIEPLRPFLNVQNIRGLEHVQLGEQAIIPTAPQFRSFPEAVWCWFKYEDVSTIWPLVEAAYTKTIDLSAHKSVNPSVRKAHAGSILEYLRSNGYLNLPQPDHSKKERSSKRKHQLFVSDPTIK